MLFLNEFFFVSDMNRQLIFTGFRALKQCKNQLAFVSTETLPANRKPPKPSEISQQNAKFDEVTHTGQVCFFLDNFFQGK